MRNTRATVILAILLSAMTAVFFARVVFGRQMLAFRDTSHYYFPLFQWIDDQWRAGHVPLWNPHENLGVPLVGEATSSVFYPGKLIFAVPGLAFVTRFQLYVLSHVGLAAIGAFLAARQLRTTSAAASLSAIAYAFGGSVVFQYCNVVFLVGAAWLPFAAIAAHRMMAGRSWRSAVGLGTTLALMTLGGDPQMAYHAGLLAALLALVSWPAAVRSAQPPAPPDERRSLWRSRLVLLGVAAGCGLGLAAIQVLPAMQWTAHSSRTAAVNPRSLYEIPESDGDLKTGLFGRPAPFTHHEHIYHFSIGPWRLAEFVCPNVFGRMFPVNRRWINVLPGEGRVWSPSLYMGVVPLVFACVAWRLRLRGSSETGPLAAETCWLSWAALLAILASFGWYGVGWLIQEVRVSLLGGDPEKLVIGQPVGGLYWFLVVVLPGYAWFRFPAKLIVVAAFAISMLAGKGFDRSLQSPGRFSRVLFGLSQLALAGSVVVFATRSSWSKWLGRSTDAAFGPLDLAGAATDCGRGLLQTFAVSLAAWFLLRLTRRQAAAGWTAVGLVVLTACDLAIANRWLIATAPSELWTQPGISWAPERIGSPSRGASRSAVASLHGRRIYRGTQQRWMPREWARTSSPNRLAEYVEWERRTLFPKRHMLVGGSAVEAYGTMSSLDFETFMRIARTYGPRRPDHVPEPHPSVLRVVGARYLVFPRNVTWKSARKTATDQLWQDDAAFPRTWIVHQAAAIPALASRRVSDRERQAQAVLFPDGTPRDFQREAVIESDIRLALGEPAADADERCVLVVDRPTELLIRAKLAAPGLIVLSDTFYPGWDCELQRVGDHRWQRTSILRANRVMRAVNVSSGEWLVRFRFRPSRFRLGLAISLSFVVLAAAAFASGRWVNR